MTRPLLLVSLAFVAGSFTGDRMPVAWTLLLLGLVAVLLATALTASDRRVRALLAAAFALGAAGRAVEGHAYDSAPLRLWVQERPVRDTPVLLRGHLAAEPRDLDDRWRLIVEVAEVVDGERVSPVRGRARVDVSGTFARPDLADGDVVEVHAVVRLPRGSATPGVEDAADRARREGHHAWGSCKSPRLVRRTAGVVDPWTRATSGVRRWSRLHLVRLTPPGQEQSLVRALVLGDRDGIDEPTAEAFRRAGTYHVLAISGAQVALLVGTLVWLSRRGGLSPGATALAVSGIAAGYAAVVGGDTPVVRAAVTAAILLLGRWLDVRGDLPNLLGAAALLLVAWRPSQVEDPSFQLSFVATLGLLLGAAPLARHLPRLPLRLELGVAASLAAQAALLPLLLLHFHRLAPAGLILNMVAVPASGVVMLLGLASLLLAPVEPLSRLVAELAWCGAHVLLLSCDPGGLASAVDVRVPDPSLVATLVYLAGLIGTWQGRRGATGPLVVGMLLLCLGRAPRADGRLHVVMLDVGQGDALVLRSPAGRTMMVDAGPGRGRFDAGEHIAAPYLWGLGVRRLDLFVLSHAHPDHAGGVPGLLRAFEVGESWEALRARSDAGYERWEQAWNGRRTTRTTVVQGYRRHWDGASLEVVGPRAPARAPWSVRNDDSLALSVRFGTVSLLLTGDVEAHGEAALASGRATVLKVAHHGSRTSTSPALVDRVRPAIALVSAGHANHFGHPHPEVVHRLLASGARLFRTDVDGTIDLATDGVHVDVCTARGGCRRLER